MDLVAGSNPVIVDEDLWLPKGICNNPQVLEAYLKTYR